MKIQLSPKEFISHFVNPLTEVNKNSNISLFCKDDIIYCVVSTDSDKIHVYCTYKPLCIENPLDRCSLAISKLVKGLQCVPSEETTVPIEFDSEKGTCSFNTKEIRFNIRLLNDNMVTPPRINIDSFLKFPHHHTIDVNHSRVSNIKKAMEFDSNTYKFYIDQEDDSVYFFFGEKNSTSNHRDDIRILVADNIKTKIPNRGYDIDILRFVLRQKNDFSIKMNDNGVIYIEIENQNTNLKYITSPLIK